MLSLSPSIHNTFGGLPSADFDAFTRRRGSARCAYPSIVAGGRNALCLHYRSNNHLLRCGGAQALFIYLFYYQCFLFVYDADCIFSRWPEFACLKQ